jgi:hypothetical protein
MMVLMTRARSLSSHHRLKKMDIMPRRVGLFPMLQWQIVGKWHIAHPGRQMLLVLMTTCNSFTLVRDNCESYNISCIDSHRSGCRTGALGSQDGDRYSDSFLTVLPY